MNLEYINELADQSDLTSYEGDRRNLYTGFGDDLVDFGGKALDFGSEIATERVFTISIDNSGTGNAAQTISLTPSYLPSGKPLNDGAVSNAPGMTANGSPKTLQNFYAFIGRNPTSVVAMKVTSTLSSQLAQTINIARKTPFGDLGTEQIVIASYTNEGSLNDKMVTIRRPFQVDDQTEITVLIPAGAVSTFTFYCGAILNTASALNNKSQKAGRNANVATARALVNGAK